MMHASTVILILICTFVEVRSVDLEYKTFRCPNGTYISNRLVCDGKIDCVGNSNFNRTYHDDSNNCDQANCGPGKFNCRTSELHHARWQMSYTCKNATVRCNTLDDCFDTNDEYNCGDEIDVENCSLGRGKYLCDDGLRCLDFNLTCDGFCNCFDCSDEKNGCLNDGYSNDNTVKSSQIACFKSPNGPLCCSEFDSIYCQECDSRNDICDHKCVQLVNTSYSGCFCDENYVARFGDIRNSKCWPQNNMVNGITLLYWTNRRFRSRNLFTHTDYVLKELTYECTASTAAHDYSYYAIDENFRSNLVYSDYFHNDSTPKNKRIFKMSTISKDEPHEVIKSDEKIVSLAVDWITNNIYYSTSSSLSVCSNDGRICKQLKSGDISIVTLAPKFGLMFWVAPLGWDLYYVVKSSMDGSSEKYFNDVNIMEAAGTMLVADELTERLYFYRTGFRSGSQIRSVTFKGDQMKVWTFDSDMHFGTVFENEIFFISNDQNRISSMNLKTKIVSQRVTIDKSLYPNDVINKLHVYNPLLQRTKIPNPCPASCSGLCLLRPSSSKGFLNYTCLNDESGSTISFGVLVFIIVLGSGLIFTGVHVLYFKVYKRNSLKFCCT
ncbi:vitellogenin receptor-like [Planococcus citri]|uniref:vitellogenin receptor-like n=1 Tax=Planococcus citri TaxID=170843 RepID=UPI0031F9D47F